MCVEKGGCLGHWKTSENNVHRYFCGGPVALSTNAQYCLNMLPLEDYQRYGRQMILDGFGLPGEFQVVPSRPSSR